jgi:GNAT superfamily N-acetyltransferase
MSQIATKTTYLEMFERPPREVAPPCPDLTIERVTRPSNAEYRRLYRAVGAHLNWVDRLVMLDEQLAKILCDDRVEVYVLSVARETAGYSELDCRRDGEIELAYFGLTPQFIGQGLGKYFLDWSLRTAWSHRPARVWVHTCDLDHPAALPNYLKAGFRIYDEQTISQFVPDEVAAEGEALRTIV